MKLQEQIIEDIQKQEKDIEKCNEAMKIIKNKMYSLQEDYKDKKVNYMLATYKTDYPILENKYSKLLDYKIIKELNIKKLKRELDYIINNQQKSITINNMEF